MLTGTVLAKVKKNNYFVMPRNPGKTKEVNMPAFQRGKIIFEHNLIGPEEGRVVTMYELSCIPPPNGSEAHFNYPTQIGPFFMQRYLQPHEMPALLEGAKLANENTLTQEALAEALCKQFFFNPIDINEKKIPAGWRLNVDCYKATVGYACTYNVYELRATSTEDFKVGDTEYPKGDTVAVFRIYTPVRYCYVRYFTWNPECCPGRDPVSRVEERSDSFPEPYYIDIFPDKNGKFPWFDPNKLPGGEKKDK